MGTITKRQILLKRQSYLMDMIEKAQAALDGLINGDIQSYNLGSWSVTRSRPDIDKLQKWINQALIELDGINNLLTGRAPRHTSTCVYTNPQNVGWWRGW